MKRAACLVAGLLLMLAVGWVATAADPPAGKANPPDKQESSDKKEPNRVKYARTYVALTKLDLEMARARNRDVPETLPPGIMLVMEERVALAELWLQEEQAEVAGQPLTDLAVKMAEIRLKSAEMKYKQFQEANRISAQSPQRMERLKLKVELAKLNVAGARDIDPKSRGELLEFELERLREEVSEMYVHQVRLLDRN